MKKILMGAVMSIAILTCCQNEMIETVEQQGRMITLEVNQNGSRTALDGKETVWTEGDQIYVTSADGNTHGVLTLVDGEDSSIGKFKGYVYGDDELKYSIYPVPENGCVKTNVHDAGKLNAMMKGTISGKTVSFENLCSLIPIGSISLSANEKVVIKSNNYPIGATIKFGLKNGELTTELVEDISEVEIVNIKKGEEIYLPVFDIDKLSRATRTINLTISIGNIEKTYNNVPLEAGKISDVEIKDLWVENGQIVEGSAMSEKTEPKVPAYNEELNEYKIFEAAELLWVADQVNSGKNIFGGATIKLYEDINLNNIEWEPIGNSSNKFDGSFDGNGKKILNLQILENGNYSGLIGRLGQNSKNDKQRAVKNLKIQNVNVYGGQYTAALIGNCDRPANISNIEILGNVKIEGHMLTGGIVGGNSRHLTNVTINANAGSYVKTYGTSVGGVAGGLSESQNVTNVTSNINVIATNIEEWQWGGYAVGGIVGRIAGTKAGCTFSNCSMSGDVTIMDADTENIAKAIGGIIGTLAGGKVTLNECVFSGKLSSFCGDKEITEFVYNSLVGVSTGQVVNE